MANAINVWQVLGIAATRDASEIRRAYARRLKTIDQRTEQEAFQTLRAAYEHALAVVRQASGVERDSRPESARAPAARPAAKSGAGAVPVADPKPGPACITEPAASEHDRDAATPGDPQPDPRERDWVRAEELVRALAEIFSSKGEAAAVEVLQTMLGTDELHSLNLRDAFEWRLLFALADTEQLPLELASTAVDFFGWENRPDLLASAAGPALQHVLRRRAAQRRYEELRQLANMHSYSAHFSGKALARKAARSLLSSYSPSRFRWQAMSVPLLAEMRSLLADIDARAPDLPGAYLDPQTVAWWRSAVANPPPSFRLLGVGFLVGLFGSIAVAGDRTGPSALGIMALVVLVTMAAFYGAAVVYRRWVRLWQPRAGVAVVIALERSIGRVFPGAVRAGLGWKHVLMTLLFAPFLGMALAGFGLFPPLEHHTGRVYPYLLMLLAGVVLIVGFGAIYQVKYWLGPRSEVAQRRWRIVGLSLLWIIAALAAAAGKPLLLGILFIIAIVRFARRRTGS